jgi:hypothetical protein
MARKSKGKKIYLPNKGVVFSHENLIFFLCCVGTTKPKTLYNALNPLTKVEIT